MKTLGWALVLVALAALSYDVMILLDKGTFNPVRPPGFHCPP